MFKLESYITPIILNHVAKYVKNIRPQDAQLSLWEGEVAFQNLDLRLDVLEEELQLPFEFLSGHIHELVILVPWTRINWEPITITINTIEFVLKLKDQEDTSNLSNNTNLSTTSGGYSTPLNSPNSSSSVLSTSPVKPSLPINSSSKQERKKKISEDNPQSYIPGIVNRIINNISINCHNIILKYVEDDIVVSMNVQLLSLKSADENWKPAFIDINPAKFILRKLLQISDLTICLDKRNSMGHIEVCQEPILYRCSLEARILRKYYAATLATTSKTQIHIFTCSLDINVSSLQFPMAMRLVALILALKEGNIENSSSTTSLDTNREDAESQRNTAETGTSNDESYLSWIWNMIPAIFPAEEDEDNEMESVQAHITNIGFYVDKLKFTLKASEFISDSILQATKKIRYIPIFRISLKGIFSETVIADSKWFNTTGGCSSFTLEPLETYSEYPGEMFIQTPTSSNDNYKDGSLFHSKVSDMKDIPDRQFLIEYCAYLCKNTVDYLLYRTPAVAMDMISQKKDYTTEDGTNSIPDKSLSRLVMSSFTINYNVRFLTIINTVQDLIKNYNYPPYGSELKVHPASPSIKLPPPSIDDYDKLMSSETPKRVIEVTARNMSIKLHPQTESVGTVGLNVSSMGSSETSLPYFIFDVEELFLSYEEPIDAKQLVHTTCQLPKKPPNLLHQCYTRYKGNMKNVRLLLSNGTAREELLVLPNSNFNVGSLLMKDLWKASDIVEYTGDIEIDSIILSFTRPQLFMAFELPETLMAFNEAKIQEILNSKLKNDIFYKRLPRIVTTVNVIKLNAEQMEETLFFKGSLKYTQSSINVPRETGCDLRIFLFRAPTQIPILSQENWCSVSLRFPLNFTELKFRNYPAVIVSVTKYALILDSAINEFFEYELEPFKTSDVVEIQSSTKITPRENEKSKRKPPLSERPSRKSINHPEETIHLSSEKEEKIHSKPIYKKNEKEEEKLKTKSSTSLISVSHLKQFIIDLKINRGKIVLPTSPGFLTTLLPLDTILDSNKTHALVILPIIKLKSSYSFEKLASTPGTSFTDILNQKHTFPWTCNLSGFTVRTRFNKETKIVVEPLATDITVAVNNNDKKDDDGFSLNFHIDTKPIYVDIHENQFPIFHTIYESTNNIYNKIMNSPSRPPQEQKSYQDLSSIIISSSYDGQTKEFPLMDSDSGSSNCLETSGTTKDFSRLTFSDSNKEFFKIDDISIWLQWTIPKLSLAITSNINDPNRIKFEVEDLISSVDKRSEYYKLTTKLGTISVTSTKLTSPSRRGSKGNWIDDDCLRISVSTEPQKNNETFLSVTLTTVDTKSFLKKLGNEKNCNFVYPTIQEVLVNAQAIEILTNLDKLFAFIPTVNHLLEILQTCEKSSPKTNKSFHEEKESSVKPIIASDLPLFHLDLKGITIYSPVNTGLQWCDVIILKLGNISISPYVTNPLPRIPIRQDIYTKAAQLRMLNTPGSKIEDRQYELQFKDISAATGNWTEINNCIKESKEQINTNPAFEWNKRNQNNDGSPIEVKEIFSNFAVLITYAPCIVYNRVLICGEALEVNFVKDMRIRINNDQIELFSEIRNLLENLQRSLLSSNETSKRNKYKIKKISSSPLPNLMENKTKHHDEQITSGQENTDRNMKTERSNETQPPSDSGIATSSARKPFSEKHTLQQKRSTNKKIPKEISIVTGVFTLEFFHSQRNPSVESLENRNNPPNFLKEILQPLIMLQVDQASVLITQKLHDFIAQASIFELKVKLCVNDLQQKQDDTDQNEIDEKFTEYLIETKRGSINNTGILPPVILVKFYTTKMNKVNIDVSASRPICIYLSKVILNHLLKCTTVLLKSIRIPQRSVEELAIPIEKGDKILLVRKKLNNADRVNLFIFDLSIRNMIERECDLYFTLMDLDSVVKFSSRSDKMTGNIKVGAIQLRASDQILLHPLGFDMCVSGIQESWNTSVPSLVLRVNFNVIHIDVGVENIKCLLKAYSFMKDVLGKFEMELEEFMDSLLQNNHNKNENIQKEIDYNKLMKVPLTEPKRKLIKETKTEIYQDDLRAGAFQFFEVQNDDNSLPLPYQVQIITKNNGIICWRYPQPRSIAKLQIYPIPMETTQEIHIRCRMEYFSEAHDNFLHFCDFNLSETEMTDIELPKRKVTSNIWRVVILQSYVLVEGRYFEYPFTSDSDEEVNAIKIDELLTSGGSENDLKLHPKALIACMRVDTSFDRDHVPHIQGLIDVNLLQINFQNQYSNLEKMPKRHAFQKHLLKTDALRNHTFATVFISNFSVHSNIYASENYTVNGEMNLSCKILDDGYLNMIYLLEEINFKMNTDKFFDSLKLILIGDLLKINVGSTILQTLIDAKFHWDEQMKTFNHHLIESSKTVKDHSYGASKDVDKFPIFSRFLIFNRTNKPINLAEVNSTESIILYSREVHLYSFRNECSNQQLVIREDPYTENWSKPFYIHEEGVQYLRMKEMYFVIRTKKMSSTQMSISIQGLIQIISMTSVDLLIQFKNGDNVINGSECLLVGNSDTSFLESQRDTGNYNFKIKSLQHKGKSWSGNIPLRNNKNLPWLVKVPIRKEEQDVDYISFWVRVVKSKITNKLRDETMKLIDKIVIIIWPMFKIQSFLPMPIDVREQSLKEEQPPIHIKGRGRCVELLVPGTHQSEHEILINRKFISYQGEEKQNPVLSFKAVDWNKFFSFDENKWTTENIYTELTKEAKQINWPYENEEELRLSRKYSFKENETIPSVLKCTPSQDFSCTLKLEIAPWCLFINSLQYDVEICLHPKKSGGIQVIKTNEISILHPIKEAFTLAINSNSQILTPEEEFNRNSLPIYVNKSAYDLVKKYDKNILFVNEKDKLVINFRISNLIINLFLLSTYENGYRIFYLSSIYVVTNLTKYPLILVSFSTKSNNKITKNYLQNSLNENNSILYTLEEQKSNYKHFCFGTPVFSFQDVTVENNYYMKSSPSSSVQYYICIKTDNDFSVPILLNYPFERMSFSVRINSKSIPLIVCLIEDKNQYFLNISEDTSPILYIDNQTNFTFIVGNSPSHGDNSTYSSLAIPESIEIHEKFLGWRHLVPARSDFYYSPLNLHNNLSSIEIPQSNICLGILIDNYRRNEENVLWTKPIRTDTSSERYCNVDLRDDIKIIVCDKHKIVKIFIIYAEEQKEFCVKDLRLRLNSKEIENWPNTQNSDQQVSLMEPEKSIDTGNLKENKAIMEEMCQRRPKLCIHKDRHRKESRLSNIDMNFFVKQITLVFFADLPEKRVIKKEVLGVYVDDFLVQFDSRIDHNIEITISNLQIDNQLYSNEKYDFPVILCAENAQSSEVSMIPQVNSLDKDLEQFKKDPLITIKISLFDEELEVQSIYCQLKPIRAYIEDIYLRDLMQYINECNPERVTYYVKKYARIECQPGKVLIPREVVFQAIHFSETLRLRSFCIEPINIVLSVHTYIRLYIALDHSPLKFSKYEKKHILSLPIRFGHAVSMNYLSEALFEAGWVVGSLEILGSPTGLARSFSTGLWDFVSLPLRGLLHGPWGFIVGVTQGSASLLRNVTAGTVNSVTKLAASVARNLDRLSLDEEHFQRTESLRRSRPQGFAEGFSQGLSGFGISLLGAVGGLARHTLEARNATEVVTGVGKGIVGAFTKPISGAAELVALSGQGMLHTVGFNTMPKQRSPQNIRKIPLNSIAECRIFAYLPVDQILFSHDATLILSEKEYKTIMVYLLRKMLILQDPKEEKFLAILNINTICAVINDETAEKNLINIYYKSDRNPEECNFTIQRIMSYVKSSCEQLYDVNQQNHSSSATDLITKLNHSEKVKTDSTVKPRYSFYMSELLCEYFIRYLNILNRIEDYAKEIPADSKFDKKKNESLINDEERE